MKAKIHIRENVLQSGKNILFASLHNRDTSLGWCNKIVTIIKLGTGDVMIDVNNNILLVLPASVGTRLCSL